MTYCLPVSPMVTTTIREAVPITMPIAVRAKRTLLVRKESSASVTISLKSIVFRAVSTKGRPVIVLLYDFLLRFRAEARDHYNLQSLKAPHLLSRLDS